MEPLVGLYEFLASASAGWAVPTAGIPGVIGDILKIKKWIGTWNAVQDLEKLIAGLQQLPRADLNDFIWLVAELAGEPEEVFWANWDSLISLAIPSGMSREDARNLAYHIYTVLRADVAAEKQNLAGKLVSMAGSRRILQAPIITGATPAWDRQRPGIVLRWTPVEGATGYEVFRDGSQVYTTRSAGSFWDVNVAAGRSYTYQLRATGPAGRSGLSKPVTATAPARTVPKTDSIRVVVEEHPVPLDVPPLGRRHTNGGGGQPRTRAGGCHRPPAGHGVPRRRGYF
ncbi:MAG: hypothetical protein K6T75_00745 [Acetobacteraceae bacterium]|nr:hypothetical protein [Acetobacteraceae bacterium]